MKFRRNLELSDDKRRSFSNFLNEAVMGKRIAQLSGSFLQKQCFLSFLAPEKSEKVDQFSVIL
jgi:hypothetical protein